MEDKELYSGHSKSKDPGKIKKSSKAAGAEDLRQLELHILFLFEPVGNVC